MERNKYYSFVRMILISKEYYLFNKVTAFFSYKKNHPLHWSFKKLLLYKKISMKTIGLNQQEVQLVLPLLENFLASENVLNLKIRNYHWNVTGAHFSEYHKYFEELYDDSAENIDEIAERIRMLGSKTKASMGYFLEKSFLMEEVNTDVSADEMIKNLLTDTEKTISEMRNAIEIISETNDSGSEDFLIALMQKHEKNAWMLRSMAQ